MFPELYVSINSAWKTPIRRAISVLWLIVTVVVVPISGVLGNAGFGYLMGLVMACVFVFFLYLWSKSDLQHLVEQRRGQEPSDEGSDQQ
jgi:Na+/melibiose symporter-like transporter